MKLKSPDELTRLSALPADVRLYLIAGPDEATVEAVGAHLLSLAGKGAERIDIDARECREDPARLATEAASLSLFAGARIVRLTIPGAGDECLPAATALIEAEAAECPVVALAPGVTNRGKLFKLAETSAFARVVQCYQPRRGDLAAIAVAQARDRHLRLSNPDALLLVDLVDGDRALIARELDKIALYLDASEDRPRQATAEAIRLLGAASHDEDIGAFVNAVLGGKVEELADQLNLADALGVNEIRLLRSLSNRVQQLARLRVQVDGGQHPKSVASAKPNGVFWKEVDAVAAQLRIWDAHRIARLNDRLLLTEQALKASGTPGGVLFRQLATDIAHQAARVR